MPCVDLADVSLTYHEAGDLGGAPVVFAHALGTDHSLWEAVLPRLPQGLRLIAYDLRGHGASDVPEGPYAMGTLVRDAERLLEHLGLRDTVFVGLSLGGMVAQGLAVKRLDLVRGLVLSNTAAKIGSPKQWQERMEAVEAGGMAAIAPATIERWFARGNRASAQAAHWRAKLEATPVTGYLGCCAAISGTDFYTPTASLRLPTLGIAGSEDGSTPADLVRETVDLIPGAEFHLIRRSGHLPCVEQPEAFAEALAGFLTRIGHTQ
ncbi:3-oxoadipate enol-lactonase [Pseudoruegeria sp. SHC-113]|uniref:3-oxoadipate enol-lactonase n=1 Tax=Pseudoruegeria sp. SHC-113 TaxID=2855439 RepID=UPI0021BA46FD|nr:3-oxoadipate enol-lactonase [Pseudoruegeria sp. SHC-113]MCT8161558.1 3-oxoadipate enol-lactonase [Pseudoruegeria sp. SHC-113]